MRILLPLIALIILGIAVFRRFSRPSGPVTRGEDVGAGVDMAACAHCGLHIPVADAIVKGGRPYCCRDHAERSH